VEVEEEEVGVEGVDERKGLWTRAGFAGQMDAGTVLEEFAEDLTGDGFIVDDQGVEGGAHAEIQFSV